MYKIFSFVDSLNEWMGRIFCWLLIPLTMSIVFDVFMRYVLNKPTIWAWDLNVLIQGAIVVLGGGYALLYHAHVSVDILVNKFKPKARFLLDSFTGLVVAVSIAILLWKVGDNAWFSVMSQEHYTSVWAPPIYPLKVIMVIGVGAILLQAIANLVRCLGRGKWV